jgi:hypothetical protein
VSDPFPEANGIAIRVRRRGESRRRFKPAKMHDVPVQIETVLTFAFSSKVADPIPILSDAEARKLANNVIEPFIWIPNAVDGPVQADSNLDLHFRALRSSRRKYMPRSIALKTPATGEQTAQACDVGLITTVTETSCVFRLYSD